MSGTMSTSTTAAVPNSIRTPARKARSPLSALIRAVIAR